MKREELVTLELRRLYEQYGYRKYRMGRFEEYDLYLENKNFLKSKQVITFHDLDGRVLALKPDVTLSIAKNTHATPESTEKFYYLENVYRLDKQSNSYSEISQLGLEYIGSLDLYATAEVLGLAQATMAAISERHRMQISHVGFLVSLMDGLSIDIAARHALLALIRGKNRHELAVRAKELGVTPAATELLVKAADLSGEFGKTLRRAREIAITGSMTEALDQLEAVYRLLTDTGRLTLDFSLINDIDYYCGVVFQGFVEGVPRAVLAGGYYGNLMKKFGLDLDAIGFAVYLNELTHLYRAGGRTDVDALVLYDEGADLGALATAAQALRDGGLRVRVERRIPHELRYDRLYRFESGALREVKDRA